MDTAAFLTRIADRGPVAPTAATLRRLHLAHMLAVPFENLDIHAGVPIVLDDEALFAKIVGRRRGGFCYELNGLFAALLRELGFRVSMLAAAVAHSDGGFGPDFDHMALLVELESRWLADVGFGDSFREPLLLDERAEQVQGDAAYRIEAERGRWMVQQRQGDGTWAAQYRFDLTPRAYADFLPRCHYHQTSPASHFTQGRTCSLATPAGRLTLRDRRLIETLHGERHERELGSEKEAERLLRQRFGFVLAP